MLIIFLFVDVRTVPKNCTQLVYTHMFLTCFVPIGYNRRMFVSLFYKSKVTFFSYKPSKALLVCHTILWLLKAFGITNSLCPEIFRVIYNLKLKKIRKKTIQSQIKTQFRQRISFERVAKKNVTIKEPTTQKLSRC